MKTRRVESGRRGASARAPVCLFELPDRHLQCENGAIFFSFSPIFISYLYIDIFSLSPSLSLSLPPSSKHGRKGTLRVCTAQIFSRMTFLFDTRLRLFLFYPPSLSLVNFFVFLFLPFPFVFVGFYDILVVKWWNILAGPIASLLILASVCYFSLLSISSSSLFSFFFLFFSRWKEKNFYLFFSSYDHYLCISVYFLGGCFCLVIIAAQIFLTFLKWRRFKDAACFVWCSGAQLHTRFECWFEFIFSLKKRKRKRNKKKIYFFLKANKQIKQTPLSWIASSSLRLCHGVPVDGNEPEIEFEWKVKFLNVGAAIARGGGGGGEGEGERGRGWLDQKNAEMFSNEVDLNVNATVNLIGERAPNTRREINFKW